MRGEGEKKKKKKRSNHCVPVDTRALSADEHAPVHAGPQRIGLEAVGTLGVPFLLQELQQALSWRVHIKAL